MRGATAKKQDKPIEPSSPAMPLTGEHSTQEVTDLKAVASYAKIYSHHAELETMWRELEADGYGTIFQTYDWAACWYDTAISCGEAEPIIAAVFDKEDRPLWILPLCLYKSKKLRIISFADMGVSDYIAPLMARHAPTGHGAIGDMVKMVLDVLPPCDVINFQKIPEKIQNDLPNPLFRLPRLEIFPVECHGIHITEPWPELKGKIMQRRLRLTIRREKRKLLGKEDVTFERHESKEELVRLMNDLLAIRRERFEAIDRPDMPDMWKSFYKNLVERNERALNASISTMKIAGEEVAICFGLMKGGSYHALLTTFKMGKWERYRPGMILFDKMLASFSEEKTEGIYFDFTVGDEVYKKRFGCESRPLYEWMMPRSAAGLAYYATWRVKLFLRRHPKLISALKKTLSRLPFLDETLQKEWRSE